MMHPRGHDRLVTTYLLLLSGGLHRLSSRPPRVSAESSQGRGAFNDLAWALVNSKEFLCRH